MQNYSAIAFVAAHLHDKGTHNVNFTFAFHRAELVGAFFNGVFLLALALSIFLQSIERFIHVEPIDQPIQVLIIGAIGLFLNVISILVVHGTRSFKSPEFYETCITDHGGHGHGHGHGNDSVALVTLSDDTLAQLRDNVVRVPDFFFHSDGPLANILVSMHCTITR
ncbi:hypothetical protein H0H81_006588 [Sphagnurus paluster]|uniref:Cation efflux protein transmembrane domain-containing protein n=1 Tax=Sphagnurus paluster TaxID=117069 RepID=A0A9P7K3L1_9AGAR|nr:hypothetical protein H0H81_006588 [Sphagnurus paluster]